MEVASDAATITSTKEEGKVGRRVRVVASAQNGPVATVGRLPGRTD